jgi:hypothetical protein
MKKAVGMFLASGLLLSIFSLAKGSHASSGYSAHGTRASSHHSKGYCYSCQRGSDGKIKRSSHPKNEFRKTHPCPSTGKTTGPCKGYVIDHRQALKHGGRDDSSNMQWQTTEAAKAKDRIE